MALTQLLRDVLSIDDQTKLIDSAPTKLVSPYGTGDIGGLLDRLIGSDEGMGIANKALEKAATKNPVAREYIRSRMQGVGGGGDSQDTGRQSGFLAELAKLAANAFNIPAYLTGEALGGYGQLMDEFRDAMTGAAPSEGVPTRVGGAGLRPHPTLPGHSIDPMTGDVYDPDGNIIPQ
jgi:hypothetical protein